MQTGGPTVWVMILSGPPSPAEPADLESQAAGGSDLQPVKNPQPVSEPDATNGIISSPAGLVGKLQSAEWLLCLCDCLSLD